ncbi:MAG: hypothetical protein AB7U79_03335 [Candidatus Izemoplasmatales bacterium]
MRRFSKVFMKMFFIASMIQLFITLAILHRLNITYGFIALTLGSLMMALFLTFSRLIFEREKGNALINILLSFLVLLPTVFILRRLYDVIIFRYTFVIYLFIGIILAIYAGLLYLTHQSTKKETSDLNNLLKKDKE